MARSRWGICLGCEDLTKAGTYCEECDRANEAVRRLRKGKTSERYGAEYQRNRKRVLDWAKAEGVDCALAVPGVCMSRPTTADHIIPKSRGGDDSVDNLQPSCSPCNSAKRDRV